MFDHRARAAFVAVAVTLLAVGIAFRVAVARLNLYLEKEPVALRGELGNISRQLGRWRAFGADSLLTEAIVEELGTTEYLERSYRGVVDGAEYAFSLHVAYYTGMIDAIPHIPDRCFAAAGMQAETLPVNYALDVDRARWSRDPGAPNAATGEAYPVAMHIDPITGRAVDVRMPIGDPEIRVIEFTNTSHPNVYIFGGYFFLANGRMTPRPEAVKLMAFQLTDRYAYYCKVQLTMAAPRSVGVETYVDLASDLVEHLMPELMRCLPDWSEVEARDAPDPPT